MNDIIKGFPTKESLLKFLIKNKFYNIENYKVVKFNNEYYGVSFQNTSKEIVIFKDMMWYLTQDGETKVVSTTNFNIGDIPELNKPRDYMNFNNAIYEEMKIIDPNMYMLSICKKEKMPNGYGFKILNTKKNCYYTLVGLFFYDVRFSKEDYYKIAKYFGNYNKIYKLIKKDIVAINPFRKIAYSEKNGVFSEVPILYICITGKIPVIEYRLKR